VSWNVLFQRARWNAAYTHSGRHIGYDGRTGTHYRVGTDRNARADGRAHAHQRSLADRYIPGKRATRGHVRGGV
jgi:hypothetical protein